MSSPPEMFTKVLVANRGEIAVRIFRACKELGIGTVAVYSEADADGGHVRSADEAFNIGPPPARDSYLDGDAILAVADRADVDAIHPGYGFLAENAEFAARVEESPFTWIGPASSVMEQLGEKTAARRVMQAADVPVVPGTTDPVADPAAVRSVAEEYGYPIAIKAVGGGGGRGLKVVRSADQVESAFESATREGDAYFDNPAVYVEKFLDAPKHIEVQVLADHHGNVRHLGERDCSLQRRHQKIVEEAPSPALDESMRERIGEAARRGVAAADYTNAGTVEFLVADDEFYFMEVNTRIQVEHPVTEAITGIDIVKWQLRIAMGEELPFEQSDVSFDGHAIEYRINAENPATDFAPNTGVLDTYDPPGGIGIRIDDAIRQGDTIGGDYDSMIAKLIVSGEDRTECLARSDRALAEFDLEGMHTTIPFHRLMVTDETFIEGTHTTRYLDEGLDHDRIETAVERWGPDTFVTDEEDPVTRRSYTVEVNGKRFEVDLSTTDINPVESNAAPSTASRSRSASATAAESTPETAETPPAATGAGEEVVTDMQGTILSIEVGEGESVAAGDVLCVLEAMKMENDIVASSGGTVSHIAVDEGESVDMGDLLMVLE